MWIGGQQVWLGPALAGRVITLWIDETTLHVLLDGTWLKTLPSRLGPADLARPWRPPVGPSPPPSGTGSAIEVERMVNGCSLASLAGTQLNVGSGLAGQWVTLRMDGTVMAIISHDGLLLRTLPCPVPAGDRHRLRGARCSAAAPPPAGPVVVQRRISQRGQIMVATQRIQVGLIHARKIATVTATSTMFEVSIDGDTAPIVPRTTTAEIHRYKAHATRAPSHP